MSNANLEMYVHKLDEVRGQVARYTSYLPDSVLWKTVHGWLERHWVDVVKPVADTRGAGMKALGNWRDYTTAVYNYSVKIAQEPDSGIKDQKDGFTPSGLKTAQHRCMFVRTWPIIQDYIQTAYFVKTAPTPSTAELLKYGYITPEAADEFVRLGCESGRTPAYFYGLLTYFPMEAAKLIITSTTPEIFAEEFGKLVDDVVEGQGVINDASGNVNEAESRNHWCPSGERSPVSIAKWASLELRNKHKNALAAR